jgi:hypothetical protein
VGRKYKGHDEKLGERLGERDAIKKKDFESFLYIGI